ncbi:hypothetical protein BH11PLA1_BH11PLA1_09260 [soil metagenome]
MPRACIYRSLRRRPAGVALGLAALLFAASGTLRAAQPERSSGPGITGRDFAGLRFRIAPQSGPLELSAQHVFVWNEDPAAANAPGTTLGAGAQRMLLQGDVRVQIGINRFAAARAVAWLERLEDASPTRRPLYQLAIYFDRLGDPGNEAGSRQSGDRLLLTATVEAEPEIAADLLERRRVDDPLVLEGEDRFARYLDAVANPGAEESSVGALPSSDAKRSVVPRVAGILVPGMSQPYEPNSPLRHAAEDFGRASLADSIAAPLERRPALFSDRGIITIAAGEPSLTVDGDERVLIVTGGVVLQYSDPRAGRSLQLSAQRAVIFMDPGSIADLARAPADKIRGIYLEGDVVATDGRFNQRANQIYYDVRNKRAMMVDAVFWTYDERRGLPLFVRAKRIYQMAANQVRAENVTIAASSFFEPQVSLAAKDVTITREPAENGAPARTVISGSDITARAQGIPFFYWPGYTGDVERFPLRDVRVENSSTSGAGIKTRWDVLGLLGIDTRADLRLDFLADAWIRRGVGLGFDSSWTTPRYQGEFFGYILPSDRGTDQLSSGVRRDRNGDARGMVTLENRYDLAPGWSLFAEANYISDENFVDAYFVTLAQTRREFTNALSLQGIEGQGRFLAEVRYNFNDFTANQYLLQQKGYTVDKLPELRYTRVGDDLFAGWMPGLITYQSDYRVARMRMNFVGPTAAELGFESNDAARDALGLLPNQSPEGALLARGFIDNNVARADTRQELALNLKLGPLTLQPFAVLRGTIYDHGFSTFAPTEDDRFRVWSAVGVRASTTTQRVYNDVENSFLDISRLRHIITPSVTAWAAGTNRSQNDLPVYDELVEGLNEGATVRAGIEQIFQTQRGAPGRYRSVDLLKINTDIVYSSGDSDRRTPIGRFFDDRPEYATLGDYATAAVTYQLTDATALTGSTVYDLELNQQARTNVGVTTEVARDFTTYIEMRFINPLDATYLAGGADLRLTSTYTLGTSAIFDTSGGRLQSIAFRLSRELPALILSAKVGYNDITRETTLGFALTPIGKDQRTENLARRIGRDQIDKDLRSPDDEPTRVPLPGE